MRTRLQVFAAVALGSALLLAPPRASAMGLCWTTYTPSVSVNVSPTSPAPGAAATITCTASPNGGAVDSVGLTVSGGTLAGAGVDPSFPTTASIPGTSGQVTWTTPAAPGFYTVQCDAVPGACTNPVSTTLSVSVGVAASAPVVGSIEGPAEVVAGTTSAFSVTATDQNQPPLPLSYTWSATGGTFTAGNHAASTSWRAPDVVGLYDMIVTVASGSAMTQVSKTVNVVLAVYQAPLAVSVRAPRRIAASHDGFAGVYLVDGKQGTPGTIFMLTVRGEMRGFATVPEQAVAVTEGAGSVWVTTSLGSVYRVDSGSGRVTAKLPLYPFLRPLGIAYDSSRMQLWVADSELGTVRIITPDGATVKVIEAAGTDTLGVPVDVAIDSAGGKAWVLSSDPNSANNLLHCFSLDGDYNGSYAPSALVARGGGVAAGPDGRVYVSDAFAGVVHVFARNGTNLGTIGTLGDQPGQLATPAGVAVMVNGDIAVASTTNGRVERFGTGAPLPATCQASGELDSDCDGLTDAWELAHGLDPYSAADALAAYNVTSFNNYEVAAFEAKYGSDPWTPPSVTVSAPALVPPGLVRLGAVVNAMAEFPGTIAWRQVSGPATVALSGASTAAPSFIGRVPGVYGFEVVAATDLVSSSATPASVAVKNVAPVADPGRVVVVAPGSSVRLDARFSSDANGGTLTYTWDQTRGPWLTGTAPGAALALHTRAPGFYTFQVTATDPQGAFAVAEVPVLVASGVVSVPVPTASPAAEVGQTVTLDGTASLFADAAPAFKWEPVDGPEQVSLTGAAEAVAFFTPTIAGRYGFALTVVDGSGQRSPPARVDVFVAEAGKALPEIQSATAAQSVVAVNAAVALEASGTGTGYAWTQVSGPAAGITDAGAATATVVPFTPGAYVFEVVAKDGGAVSVPARVAFEARTGGSGGTAIPVARASVPGLSPVVGQLVFLDGRASTRAARYRWTQVAGPWVTLGSQGAVTTFRPPDPGTYAFELEVDDGTIRSAPVRVEVVVSEQGVQ